MKSWKTDLNYELQIDFKIIKKYFNPGDTEIFSTLTSLRFSDFCCKLSGTSSSSNKICISANIKITSKISFLL